MPNILNSHHIMNTLRFFMMFYTVFSLTNRTDSGTGKAVSQLDNSLGMNSAIVKIFFPQSFFVKETHAGQILQCQQQQQFQIMNSEVDFEKVQEIQFHGVSYIVTTKANAEGLYVEVEDKLCGEFWQYFYEPSSIESITSKTGSAKRYNVFCKMLLTALKGTSESLQLDLLTHQDIQNQQLRKGLTRTTDPVIMKRRYLIMSYMAEFDKVSYPIPINFNQCPTAERLKLTIRRLSQQLKYLQNDEKPQSIINQISAIKHENQLLKSRIANMMRKQTKQNHNGNTNLSKSNIKQLEEQIKILKEQLQKKDEEHAQQLQIVNQELQKKEVRIKELQQGLRKQKNNQKQGLDQLEHKYEEKFTKFQKQTQQLISQLQHYKEIEKKSAIKIDNLEKQLEKMMAKNKKMGTTAPTNNTRKSQMYMRSPSVKSLDSKGSNNKSKNIKVGAGGRRTPSVYDSDTESSRMRKANNNRTSPYRQVSRPLNTSNSATKKYQPKNGGKFSNISNIHNANINNGSNRSRSRSQGKSVKRKESPPQSNIETSIVMTENNGYATDEEEQTESRNLDTMERLRNHRAQKLMQEKRKGEKKNQKKTYNPVQDKISSIAQALRNFKSHNQ